MKVIPLSHEIGDIYIIQNDLEVSEKDIVSLAATPGPNNLFYCRNSSLFQLCEKVCTFHYGVDDHYHFYRNMRILLLRIT